MSESNVGGASIADPVRPASRRHDVRKSMFDSEGLRSLVNRYYNETWFEYRFGWLNKDNLALHFGYHDEHNGRHADGLTNANRVLADTARISPGERVLDAGCGLGGSGLWLAKHRQAQVVGITLVEDQVRKARAIAKAKGFDDQLIFQVADYTKTDFPDESFDVVWALESLCHAPHKKSFYREAARVLRPGGRLVVAEYVRARRDIQPSEELIVREWLDGWIIPDIDTPAEHTEAAEEAGLVNVRLDNSTHLTGRSIRRLHFWASAFYPVFGLLRMAGVRNELQHANVLSARRQYQALRKNLWFYGILSAEKH